MTICGNGQSGDRVKMIGFRGWLGAMFEHTMQFALILQIEASIPGQYTNLLARAFVLTTPWCAECRQCRTFLRWVLGMTILWSNNIRPSSVLRWCLTSQYSWTSGAVKLLIFHIVDCHDLLHGLGLVIWLYYCCLQMLPSRWLILLYHVYCWIQVYLTEMTLLKTHWREPAP